MKPLTEKQMLYAKARARGKTKCEAEKISGIGGSVGSRIERLPEVQEAIKNIQNEEITTLNDKEIWSKVEMLKTLKGIAEDAGQLASSRVSAIAQGAKMLGYDEPIKVEVNLGLSLLDQIRGVGGPSEAIDMREEGGKLYPKRSGDPRHGHDRVYP